jgi:hypothetical protein
MWWFLSEERTRAAATHLWGIRLLAGPSLSPPLELTLTGARMEATRQPRTNPPDFPWQSQEECCPFCCLVAQTGEVYEYISSSATSHLVCQPSREIQCYTAEGLMTRPTLPVCGSSLSSRPVDFLGSAHPTRLSHPWVPPRAGGDPGISSARSLAHSRRLEAHPFPPCPHLASGGLGCQLSTSPILCKRFAAWRCCQGSVRATPVGVPAGTRCVVFARGARDKRWMRLCSVLSRCPTPLSGVCCFLLVLLWPYGPEVSRRAYLVSVSHFHLPISRFFARSERLFRWTRPETPVTGPSPFSLPSSGSWSDDFGPIIEARAGAFAAATRHGLAGRPSDCLT